MRLLCMTSGHKAYRAGLFGTTVEIEYNSDEAGAFLHYLFQDLPPDEAPLSDRRFEVLFVGKPTRMSLWYEERQLYFGVSKHALASILAGEILYECVVNNKVDLAIHAAALTCGDCGILLPGKSGSGKSSLAAWLTAEGCTYQLQYGNFADVMHVLQPLLLAEREDN